MRESNRIRDKIRFKRNPSAFLSSDFASNYREDQLRRFVRENIEGSLLRKLKLNLLYGFRARVNRKGEKFNHVNEMWHPPSELTTLQRFNLAGQPKLYILLSLATSLKEVRAKEGDRVTICRLKPREGYQFIDALEIGIAEKSETPGWIKAALATHNPLQRGVRESNSAAKRQRHEAIKRWIVELCSRHAPTSNAN